MIVNSASFKHLNHGYSALVFFVLQPSHKYLIYSYLISHENPRLVFLAGAAASECASFITRHFIGIRQTQIISLPFKSSKFYSLLYSFVLSLLGLLSRVFLRKSILVLKSASYHQPLLSNIHFFLAYLGDGFGITTLDGQMPPWLASQNGNFDRINSPPINEGLVVFDALDSSLRGYPQGRINFSLASQLRLILLRSAPSLISPRQLNELKSYSDILFLNRLGGVRLYSGSEPSFWAEYISSVYQTPPQRKLLLIPHPSLRPDQQYADLLSSEISKVLPWLRFTVLSNTDGSSALSSLLITAEELASVYVQYQDEFAYGDGVIFHLFQSGVFPLYSIFPELNIEFGFGPSLIRKYFWSHSALLQEQFENYVNLEFLSLEL